MASLAYIAEMDVALQAVAHSASGLVIWISGEDAPLASDTEQLLKDAFLRQGDRPTAFSLSSDDSLAGLAALLQDGDLFSHPQPCFLAGWSRVRRVKTRDDLGALCAKASRPVVIRASRRGKPAGIEIRCTKLRSWQISAWLGWRARIQGLTLQPDALRALAAWGEDDVVRLRNELGKLSLRVGSPGPLSVGDVTSLLPPATLGRFSFANTLIERRGRDAVADALKLLEQGEPLLVLVAGLQRFLSQLLACHPELPQSTSPTLPPQLRRTMTQRAQTFSLQHLATALAHSHQLELRAKSSQTAATIAELVHLLHIL